MVKALSCVNLKGGVGKTALAVHLAIYAGMQGFSTLIVDCDPQTNATFCLMSPSAWETHAITHGTLANVLGLRSHTNISGKEKAASEVILNKIKSNLDLLPSHLELFAMDLDLASENAREFILRRKLKDITDSYDLIIFDCPPNLTLPTRNALAMSSHFIVPVAPDFLAGIGVGLLLNRIGEIAEGLEVDLSHAGIVINRYVRKSNHRDSIVAALRNTFKDSVLPDIIHERDIVSASISRQQSVFDSKDSKAISEFTAVCSLILERMGF